MRGDGQAVGWPAIEGGAQALLGGHCIYGRRRPSAGGIIRAGGGKAGVNEVGDGEHNHLRWNRAMARGSSAAWSMPNGASRRPGEAKASVLGGDRFYWFGRLNRMRENRGSLRHLRQANRPPNHLPKPMKFAERPQEFFGHAGSRVSTNRCAQNSPTPPSLPASSSRLPKLRVYS